MTLQEQLKKDLAQAMKDKDTVKKDALRVVLGELARADSKELADNEVVRNLKKLIKSERELLEKKGDSEDSEFIKIIEAYLPKMATEAEIKSWIAAGMYINFSNSKCQVSLPIQPGKQTFDARLEIFIDKVFIKDCEIQVF